MSARRWIVYDWFKLAVAMILALFLLWLGLIGRVAPVTTLPAPIPTTAAGLTASPQLMAPAPGAQVPAGGVTLNGRAGPGAAVRVLIDGVVAGTTRAGSDGMWSLPITLDQPGQHQIVVQALDSGGAVVAAADPVAFSVAASQPLIAAPALVLPAEPPLAGQIALAGTGTPGSEIDILVDGASIGRTKVGADGTWSLPVSLAAGAHEIVARTLDASGQPAAASSPARLDVQAPPIAAPTVAPPVVAAPAIGFPADGARIDVAPFTMTGTGAPGAELEILDSDKVLGTVKVGPDGRWSFPVTPSAGTASYGVRPVGAATVVGTPIRVTAGAGQVATCTGLATNCDAWVTREGGLRLRLRAAGNLRGDVLEFLPPGTQMMLLEGPRSADGYRWWRVRTLGGREGWVAGEELRAQPD